MTAQIEQEQPASKVEHRPVVHDGDEEVQESWSDSQEALADSVDTDYSKGKYYMCMHGKADFIQSTLGC